MLSGEVPQEPQEIEVEVIDTGGPAMTVRPHPADEPVRPDPDQRRGHPWHGRVRTLDMRWWPLWVLLGIIALVLAATVGVVVGIIYLVLRTIGRLVSAILR